MPAIDSNSEVAGTIEKPELHHCIRGGVYAFKGTALHYIPDRQFFTVPDLIQNLRACNRPVGAFHIKDFWQGLEEFGHIEKVREILNGYENDHAFASAICAGCGEARQSIALMKVNASVKAFAKAHASTQWLGERHAHGSL